MRRLTTIGLAGALCAAACAAAVAADPPSARGPAYTSAGALTFPADYRTWVYLSSGYNMAYTAMRMPGMSQFDNVFADPAAYAAFQRTGTWPDKTMLVLEPRQGAQNGSINKAGSFQTDRLGLEVHVKDAARFPNGGWGFYAFPSDAPGKLLPPTADCYACHAAHAAVDTTFVQFYPTLKPLAAAKATFSANYTAEEAAAPKP